MMYPVVHEHQPTGWMDGQLSISSAGLASENCQPLVPNASACLLEDPRVWEWASHFPHAKGHGIPKTIVRSVMLLPGH